MTGLKLITLGLLAGWLIEWVIDWLYWRRKYQRCRDENAHLKAQIEWLQKKLSGETARKAKKERVPRPDDFTLIRGIGPVITERLNDAGITTFEALAATTPKKLRTILGDLIERLADEENLLQQAKNFAKEKELAREARKKKKDKKIKKQKKNKIKKKDKKYKDEKSLKAGTTSTEDLGKEELPG